jgi:hypothetical protein
MRRSTTIASDDTPHPGSSLAEDIWQELVGSAAGVVVTSRRTCWGPDSAENLCPFVALAFDHALASS